MTESSALAALSTPVKVKPQRPRDAKGRLISQAAPPPPPPPNPPAVEAADEPQRPQRRSLGRPQSKLWGPPREGFYRRWINEYPGRIEEAIACGYAHVNDSRGRPMERVVDKGSGLKAYYMEIPLEFWEHDQKVKQFDLAETHRQIFHGKDKVEPGDMQYMPRDASGQPIARERVSRDPLG
jgi:hypothetical protein